MFIFAHLRKCAGTSVINAAQAAGIVLPPSHVNGHPGNAQGDAIGGFSSLDREQLEGLLRRLVEGGVQLTAIEWDFPRFEMFPQNLGLRFFTIMRDPAERLVSNFLYDVAYRYTRAATLGEYLEQPHIWTRGNYYTRFFSGLGADERVDDSIAADVANMLRQNFKYAFFGGNLLQFLQQDVGLPFASLPRSNRTGLMRRLIHRPSHQVADGDFKMLREINRYDYKMLEALRA